MTFLKPIWPLLLLAAAACKQDPGARQPNPPSNPVTVPVSQAVNQGPELLLYAINVDNLLIRDQPSQKGSNVVAKFSQGDFLTGTGERGGNKEEAVLRGIPYTDNYVRVTSTTPERQSGWAFAAALTPVFAGKAADSPDLGQLTALATHLKGLDPKKIASGQKAWNYVRTQYANAKGPMADAAYILLNQFLFRMEVEGEFYTLTDKINWTESDYEQIANDRFDMNKYPVTQSFKENGFRLETGEGMVFPIADWEQLHTFFSPKVTPVMKQYLDQNLRESRDLESDDGGLLISLDQMAERAAFWEKFNRDNPGFVLSDRSLISEQWMRNVLISGMDNTPMYNYETKAIEAQFKEVWAKVQQQYPNTKLAQKCKEISDLCAQNGWKYTEAVERWLMAFQEETNY